LPASATARLARLGSLEFRLQAVGPDHSQIVWSKTA
jgi:hypothetical protein